MENDSEYRKRVERREEKRNASDTFRKQQFNYEIKKSAEEDRIRLLAAEYDKEYNNAIRHIRTDDPLDKRITDEDIYKKNEERIKRQIDDFIKKENDYLGEIKIKYEITEPINSNKVKAYAYAETSNLYKEEINGGKPKKSRKNRKGKKYSKKNKKYKKKPSGKRKKQGRKTRRKN